MTEKSLFQESVIIARRLPNQTRIVASYYKPNLFDSRDQIPNHTGQRGHNSQSFVHLLKKKRMDTEKSARREVFNYNRKFKWVWDNFVFDSFYDGMMTISVPGSNCWASRWSWRTCRPSTAALPTSSSSSRTTSPRRSTSGAGTPSLLEGCLLLECDNCFEN